MTHSMLYPVQRKHDEASEWKALQMTHPMLYPTQRKHDEASRWKALQLTHIMMYPMTHSMTHSMAHPMQRKHDKAFQWKALRMISRVSLPIFAKTAIDSDLEVAARALYPTEVPSLPSPVAAASQSVQARRLASSCCCLCNVLATLQMCWQRCSCA